MGVTATADSIIQAALDLRYNPVATSTPPDATLIDDFDADGAYALQMPITTVGQSLLLRMEFPTAYQVVADASVGTFVIGARYKVPDTASSEAIFRFHTSAGSAPNLLKIKSNGTDLELDDGDTTETIVSAVTEGSWHYIEWHFKPTSAANGGMTKVYVDDVEVFSDTSRNVLATFFSVWGFSILGPSSMDHTGNKVVAYDDLYVLAIDGDNSARLADGVIRRHAVTSDATPNDWTPNIGGTNYTQVDEQIVDQSDFVSTATGGHDDHYGVSAALTATGNVIAVAVEVESEDTTTSTLHVGLDDGTADESSGATAAFPVYTTSYHAKTPDGSAWTNGLFDAIEATIRFEA